MISVKLDGRSARPLPVCGKNFERCIFSRTLNLINIKLCMMVVLIELYPFIPLSVPLILFYGHSSVRYFEMFCAHPIKLRLCSIVYYIK